MTRETTELPLPKHFTESLAHLASEFPVAMVLNSNRSILPDGDNNGTYDFLAAYGEASGKRVHAGCFDALQAWLEDTQDWVFCALSYDLKNEVENLVSENTDGTGFPACHFFTPIHVLAVPRGQDHLYIHSLPGHSASELAKTLQQDLPARRTPANKIVVKARTGREEYLKQAEAIRRHIQRGDIYEMNYCMEFFAEDVSIHPVSTWLALNERSPMPFACYYRSDDFHLLCASPERFLKKKGMRVISQPIKGTAPRGKDADSDKHERIKLAADEKEMAENIMIVDLVRNDLSRTAVRGTVRVDELMGIHTFPALHQMISTVSAEVDHRMPATKIIRAAFPMGSMTGAPKVRAMQLIEEYENARRGLFSGSVGYFTPGGDFDLNVVIRSIQYREERYLSFSAGSAITVRSDAEKEYEECRLKAQTMLNVLAHAE